MFFPDIENEEIHLCETEATLAVGSLGSKVPDNNARYHLYRFDHHYEGDFFHCVRKYIEIKNAAKLLFTYLNIW